ncbi:homoserine dehydrogenase [Desulfocurvibacter africanus]|uniref:Homoserine dehydrogenase n=1 Tax=Desulfocurvibacter africanus subsp. africanus str. Walvis Bay TaxID=690850 RepID=F3Z0H1_DESAF|nr:homoserine dehydrogenase [Desulfocurvibacter africanus]EGJ50981.1 homoserine dehydrogenase [Desulfocurvibacter africanus subsp. africanus str. Walvis Bay]
MNDVIRLGLAGFGTVGSGVAKVIAENGELIRRRTGKRLHIKTVLVRNLTKARAFDPGQETSFTSDPSRLWADPEIDIVVELMGGTTTAYDIIEASLNAGKHVVTANKALLAERGRPLFQLAGEKGLGLYYEASVAGGIPIVQTLKESLAANRIEKIVGILNGTANYVLSEMTTSNLEFETALEQAKLLGYAEADPTLDIEGIDAAHKLIMLIRLAYGAHYPFEQLPVTGISGVTSEDIRLVYEFGYRLKLIGQAREVDGKIEAGVFPALVKYTYLLARVGGNYNAVRVEANAAGPLMFSGQGAGGLPTGSAVLADILSLVKCCGKPDNTGFTEIALPDADILDPDLAVAEHYFRFTVADRPGVMAAIAGVMGELNISIAQAVQKGAPSGRGVPIVFLTHAARTCDVHEAVRRIDAQDFIEAPTVHYRIL